MRIFSKVCQEFGGQGKKKRSELLSLTAEEQPQGEGDQSLDIPFLTPHPKQSLIRIRQEKLAFDGGDDQPIQWGDARNIAGTHVQTVFQFFTGTVQVLLTGCIGRLLSLTCSCKLTTLLKDLRLNFFKQLGLLEP